MDDGNEEKEVDVGEEKRKKGGRWRSRFRLEISR